MTKCKTYQELISRMIDEDLTEAERSELSKHVKRCPDCAAVYVAFARCRKAFRPIWPSRPLRCIGIS